MGQAGLIGPFMVRQFLPWRGKACPSSTFFALYLAYRREILYYIWYTDYESYQIDVTSA